MKLHVTCAGVLSILYHMTLLYSYEISVQCYRTSHSICTGVLMSPNTSEITDMSDNYCFFHTLGSARYYIL